MKSLRTSKKNFKKIYYDLGTYLQKLHSIKGKGFGSVNSHKLIGKEKTLEKTERDISNSITSLESLDYYSSKLISEIRVYFEDHKHLLKAANSRLLHGDISEDNIMMEGN